MHKKVFDLIVSLDKNLNTEELTKEVLSKDFIKNEIKRLNLSDFQIKKGMVILQKYHDYIEKYKKAPSYTLFVDDYGFLAEDYSNDQYIIKQKRYNNFWLTSITELDSFIQEYFDTKKDTSIFSELKKSIKKYINTLINTKESQEIKKEFSNILSKAIFNHNIWIHDPYSDLSYNILKYIAAVNAINFNKSVAYISSNDLYNYITYNQDEKRSILWHLNKVEVLIITNLTLGIKPQWFLDFLLNVFETRNQKGLPILISSSRDILSPKTKLLSSYYYSKEENSNDLEDLFKQIIKKSFKKIAIN